MREWIDIILGWLEDMLQNTELPAFMVGATAAAVALSIAPAVGLVQSVLPGIMGQNRQSTGFALADLDTHVAVQASQLRLMGACVTSQLLAAFLCQVSGVIWLRAACLCLFIVALCGTLVLFFSTVRHLGGDIWRRRAKYLSHESDVPTLTRLFGELWSQPGTAYGEHEVELLDSFMKVTTELLRRKPPGWQAEFRKRLTDFKHGYGQRDLQTRDSPNLLRAAVEWAGLLHEAGSRPDAAIAKQLQVWTLQLCGLIWQAGFRTGMSGEHARILGPAWAQHADDLEGPCATAFLKFLHEGLDYSVETGDAVWIDLLPDEWIICERNLSGPQLLFVQQLYFTFSMWLLPSFGPWELPPERSVSAVANELFLQANPQVVVDLMWAARQAPVIPSNGVERKPLIRIQFAPLYQGRMFTLGQLDEVRTAPTAAAIAVAEQNTFSLMAQLEPTLSKAADVRVMAERYERCLPDDRAGAHYAKLLLRLADFLDREG